MSAEQSRALAGVEQSGKRGQGIMGARRINQRAARTAVGMMALGAIVLCTWRAGRLRNAELPRDAALPPHVLTAQQIAERATPICRLLGGKGGELHQTTERLTQLRDNCTHIVYAVDCDNSAGQHIIHTVWDAETGRLMLAGHELTHRTRRYLKPPSLNRPVSVAWQWLEQLSVAQLAPRWQVATPPKLIGITWLVILQGGGYRALVNIDQDTGDLISMSLTPK
jgi:hypothetical protein